MADIQKMVDQLDFLIKAASNYEVRDGWLQPYNMPADAIVLGNRLESAIERSALAGTVYIKQLDDARALPQPQKFLEVQHVAIGLRDDLIAGWYSSVVELVHADTYGDYLEMAEGLLDQGYKDPAAVITGTSLEVHVRSLCVKHGVDIAMPNGSPKKADTMNADLKKAGVYDGLQQKQITAWMDLRNKAAHGNYSDYDQVQVRLFIEGVRAFMMKHPA
ncbi:hypothetical protein [Streptomyces sp. AC555_RSS877]|uniref:hypothetical protein n=1 Tax=Streptomyces sp. AC555_RSS877 TaxID=2823688 RepID=UPI001C267545|nr:hypothetical protein [Streptomyces sp. AC555_RSS877]